MSQTEKAIKVIKAIREREEKYAAKASFCREHNFNLDAQKSSEISEELRKVCSLIQIEFETGYVSWFFTLTHNEMNNQLNDKTWEQLKS